MQVLERSCEPSRPPAAPCLSSACTRSIRLPARPLFQRESHVRPSLSRAAPFTGVLVTGNLSVHLNAQSPNCGVEEFTAPGTEHGGRAESFLNLIAAIKDGTKLHADELDGLRMNEILDAMERSRASGIAEDVVLHE